MKLHPIRAARGYFRRKTEMRDARHRAALAIGEIQADLFLMRNGIENCAYSLQNVLEKLEEKENSPA